MEIYVFIIFQKLIASTYVLVVDSSETRRQRLWSCIIILILKAMDKSLCSKDDSE